MAATQAELRNQRLNKVAKAGHKTAKFGLAAVVGLPLLTLNTAIKATMDKSYLGDVVSSALNIQNNDPFLVGAGITLWAGIAAVVALSGSDSIEKINNIHRQGADSELNKGNKTKHLDVDYSYLKSASRYTLLTDMLNRLKKISHFVTKDQNSKPDFLHKFDKYGLEQINIIHALTSLAKIKPEVVGKFNSPTLNDPTVKAIFNNADNLMDLLAENTPNLARFTCEMKQAIGDKAAFVFSERAYDSFLGASDEYTKIIDESLVTAIRNTKEFTVFAAFSKHLGDLIHEKEFGNLDQAKMKHFLKGFQEVANLDEYIDVHYETPMANNPTFPRSKIGRADDLRSMLNMNAKIMKTLEKAIENKVENPSLKLPAKIRKAMEGYNFDSIRELHPEATIRRRNFFLKTVFKDTIPKGKTLEGAFVQAVCDNIRDKMTARLEKTKNAPNPNYKKGNDKKERSLKIDDPKELADEYMASILSRIAGKRYDRDQMNMHKLQKRTQILSNFENDSSSLEP